MAETQIGKLEITVIRGFCTSPFYEDVGGFDVMMPTTKTCDYKHGTRTQLLLCMGHTYPSRI